MVRKQLNIILIGLLFPLLLFSMNDGKTSPIRLEAFSGPGSVMLIWDLPEEEVISSIRLYRSRDLMESYDIINLGDQAVDRYLDKDVSPGGLLFYKLEIQTLTGNILSSASNTPSFAKPSDDNNILTIISGLENKYTMCIKSLNDIKDIHIFNSALVNDYLLNMFNVGVDNVNIVQMYLMFDEISVTSFLDVLSYKDFTSLGYLFENANDSKLKLFIDHSYDELEPLIRQEVLLTPQEWEKNANVLYNIMSKKLSTGKSVYKDDVIFLENISSVRIIGEARDDSIFVWLSSFDEENINIDLRFKDEIIPVSFGENKIMSLPIPVDWDYIELWSEENMFQTVPVITENGSMTISLDNQYIFKDSLYNIQTMRSIPKQDFHLNEISFRADDRLLTIETAGKSDWTTHLGLFVNDSLLWEWSTEPVFDISYYDSSWILSKMMEFPWIHLCRFDENDEWEIIESRPLILSKSIHECRIPDLGQWGELSFQSFGESNDITKAKSIQQMIPEIFALYQNYPNPFNSSTKITFDLLQEATVNLFVTDARGRKLDVFLEETFLDKGQFSYHWSGEFRSSGIYFITLQAQTNDFLPVVMSRKMIYLK